MMTGSLKKKIKKKKIKRFFFYFKKGGGPLIRACSLIRSNTVFPDGQLQIRKFYLVKNARLKFLLAFILAIFANEI